MKDSIIKKTAFSLSFLFIMFIQTHLYGQFDYIGYVNGFPILENSWMINPKMSIRNESASANGYVFEIGIYNDDLTLYKELNISTLMPAATDGFGWLYNNDRKEFYTTQTFFNNDDLLEFFVFDIGTLTTLGFFAIVNENGSVLFQEEGRFSGKFFLFEIGAKKYFFAKTSSNNNDEFLIYEITDGSGASKSDTILNKIGIFPNPATDHINIAYKIDEQSSLMMNITNISGQIIETISLDPHKEQYKLDVSGYLPGTYIYHYGNTTGKFIVR
ncbi:MAG: T9SS type A sorting domain-containing protein [Bacteroidales bacterium]|jgi:hypothetical protein|nr:T9SS type A sorting domain-containing protein [Bacteroidales bacterium]